MIIKEKKYKLIDFIIIPFKTVPILSSIKIVDNIINALIPSITVLATAKFIDTALDIFAGEKSRGDIFIALLLLMFVVTYKYIDYALMNFVVSKINIKLSESIRIEIIEKRANLEYQHIENDDTWEVINRVCSDPVARIYGGFDIILRMTNIIVQIGSLLAILFVQVWWAAFLIISFSIPLFNISIKTGKTNYDAYREAAKHERRAKYFSEIMTSRENVEERSMFGYTNDINSKWFEKFDIARVIKLKVEAKNFIRMKGASLITVLISFLISIVLIRPLGSGEISIGMFIAFITATLSIIQMVSFDLSEVTSEMANNREYLKDLSHFCALSEQQNALNLPSKNKFVLNSLEFRNVSFKYPNTEKLILDHCSFLIMRNKNYAFVGINGAGKTTITKLITGLYDNYEGEILINEKNIRTFTQAELKAIFAVVYQDFARYAISFKDNIALGNINGISNDKIQNAIDLLELGDTIKKAPNGIETNLGKIKEDGIDLSGGQWQRVAIARLIVSDAAISILDEPTAALDPMAESNVYNMFRRVSHNKTVIFITHRLGAAKLADKIFVIAGGKVSEEGTHDELMRIGGMYAEMFEAQKGWYINE